MRPAALLCLLLVPMAATAQVYTWKDASGKIHYTDQPPSDRSVQTRRLGMDPAVEEDTSAARKSAADRRLESSKKKSEADEAAAKAAKERAADEQRQKDCVRARNAVEGIESGQIRFRMGADGEREALEGAARDAELADARRFMESACSAKAAPAAAPAAPKRQPGY